MNRLEPGRRWFYLHKLNNRKTGLLIACPITNQSKGYPFEVPIPSGCGVTGVVLCDQFKSLDWQARKAAFQSQALAEVVAKVLAKALLLLK